ncbi:SprT family protein [Vagococcus elongatus]|uniref:SprT family protein n=1 Tax=Vagococcus elongatus TaxID=180344 RepID=A0A430AXC1_9ENTE|nr:SprT family protein [Vagococcus elongatus]RSU12710.1 SprT family protein [Vagococcus elongatus]
MGNAELQELVKTVSLRCFGKEFYHSAFFNGRLQTTGGRYHLNDHHIDINPRVFEKYGWTELIDVIIHELCHYHLHLSGQGYQHRDQTFKELLKKTGGSRFVRPLTQENHIRKFIYQCLVCEKVYPRKRRMSVEKYCCPCGGRLNLVKERKKEAWQNL